MNVLNKIINITSTPMPTLGICIPVWNRGNLFKICFDSLIKQLDGIDATIWIYDNGSDKETREIIQNIECKKQRVIKTFLPQNMGIPYVANLFGAQVQQSCDFVNYTSPQYVMIMDSDAYFKKPLIDLIDLCNKNYLIGIISGHDSIEHKSIYESIVKVNNRKILLKQKENERMLTMLMRKDDYLSCYPFPHFRDRDVDWELTQWNVNSMKQRNKGIFSACDYVLHLGFSISTWQSDQATSNHTAEEISEVQQILKKHHIL